MKPKNKNLHLNPPLTLEWREHGRWVKSEETFKSEKEANEHAEIIGTHAYRLIEIPQVLVNQELQIGFQEVTLTITTKPRFKIIVRK